MIYTYSATIPKNTLVTAKHRTDLPLCRGIIHKIEVQFPVGCSGVLRAHINDALNQVWPTNGNSYFASDGHVISFDESYEMLIKPYLLTLWSWNISTEFSHEITVNIGILPKKNLVHYILPEAINLFLNK